MPIDDYVCLGRLEFVPPYHDERLWVCLRINISHVLFNVKMRSLYVCLSLNLVDLWSQIRHCTVKVE